ncbi:MAG: hypothetical protein ABI586_00070 [Candidatus Nanopelagicales bacterium]
MMRSTKAGSVLAAAALSVGVMGMAQADPHSTAIALPGGGLGAAHLHHDGTSIDPAPVQVLTEADEAAIRQRGHLPKLTGSVNDARQITISPNVVSAGRYRIVVNDSTTGHNWHIHGRGVDEKTSVAGMGQTVFRVRLRVDKYVVKCDIHPTSMRTSLTVN